MSEKSLYKKLVDTWFDDDKSQQRARENRFYEKANSEKVGAKPESKAKPSSRADHKHEYAPVVIWRKYVWRNEIGGASANAAESAEKRKKIILTFVW